MFFVGICIDGNHANHGAVVVEKVLRNAKKEYHVHDILSVPSHRRGGDPVASVQEMYQSSQYARKKKVFSQNKRPAKHTVNPPMVLIHEKTDGSPVICRLRDLQVPVEAFYFHDLDGWERKDQKIIRQGGNFYLHPKTLNAVDVVFTSSRITVSSETVFQSDLLGEIDRYMASVQGPGTHPDVFSHESYFFLPSLFLTLWHCETVRRIKRY